MDYKDMFIGELKITKYKVMDRVTENGNQVIKVTLQDKSEVEYPALILDKIASDEEKNLTFVVDETAKAVVQTIIGVLLEYEVTLDNVSTILDRVQINVQQSTDMALSKLWGKDRFKVTMHDINKTLIK